MSQLTISAPTLPLAPQLNLQTSKGLLMILVDNSTPSWGKVVSQTNSFAMLVLTTTDEARVRETLIAANGQAIAADYHLVANSNRFKDFILPGNDTIVLDSEAPLNAVGKMEARALRELQAEVRALRKDQKLLTDTVLKALDRLEPSPPCRATSSEDALS